MQPLCEGDVYLVGKIWSYRSQASDDLNRIYEMISDIPRCDTKKEMVYLIRRASSALDCFKHKVQETGNDYTLKDVIE